MKKISKKVLKKPYLKKKEKNIFKQIVLLHRIFSFFIRFFQAPLIKEKKLIKFIILYYFENNFYFGRVDFS